MRQRGSEVWESLGQADNLVARKLPRPRRDIHDGRSDARLFERGGPQELGADRTGDFDLSSARSASVTTRPPCRARRLQLELPYDRPTLRALAKDLVDKGLPAEPSGDPFKGSTDREPDKVPIRPHR